MKEYLKKAWHIVKTSTWLKYGLVTIFAVVFIGFADDLPSAKNRAFLFFFGGTGSFFLFTSKLKRRKNEYI